MQQLFPWRLYEKEKNFLVARCVGRVCFHQYGSSAEPFLPRTEEVNFTCQVGSCEQTITVLRCRTLTVGEKYCVNCGNSKLCCGIEVCSALLGGPCEDGFVPPEQISEGLQFWRPEQLEWAYVPDCRGKLVRLSILAERIRKNVPVRPV